ncbi:MAG: hypothetical protein M3263_02610 [Thermoproteota archaeon]|nr:hypothetical protein [Thermoproteota archaeon]
MGDTSSEAYAAAGPKKDFRGDANITAKNVMTINNAKVLGRAFLFTSLGVKNRNFIC